MVTVYGSLGNPSQIIAVRHRLMLVVLNKCIRVSMKSSCESVVFYVGLSDVILHTVAPPTDRAAPNRPVLLFVLRFVLP